MKKWTEEFENPSASYRAFPFWSWNGRLDKALIKKQIDDFSRMGYGGFIIHSRVGLSDEYMGEHFIDCVKYCISYAQEKKMKAMLYDEDKWPSGYGGGFVTKDPDTRARCLLLSKTFYEDGFHMTSRRQPNRLTENGVLHRLAAYKVELDENGKLVSYRRLDCNSDDADWYAYEVVTDPLPWFNMSPYGDLLNPKTAERLIEVCYSKYYEAAGKYFGSDVPAIFTDEPQHIVCHSLRTADSCEDLIMPYTKDMDSIFEKETGYSILDRFPEVIWNTDGPVSRVRYQLHKWLTKRFTDSYFGVLGSWCAQHGIMLTGHVMREESLHAQTTCIGDAMSTYTQFQLPGLDILAHRREFSTAKQVQSTSAQYGKNGVICELFGVTNWDFPFRGHKREADWLMALGTTVRVPHLAWMYMGGESKRDYPAPLDSHSPWYERYKILEDYFARVSVVTTQGKPSVRIAVVHPIESCWAMFGPDDQSLEKRSRLDRNFTDLIDWLLFSTLDFHFISESSVPDKFSLSEDGKLCIGEMEYDALVVPPLVTIRSTTVDMINSFAEAGGSVFIAGQDPEYVDACRKTPVFDSSVRRIGFSCDSITDSLEPFREIKITDDSGRSTDNLVYQLRKDGSNAYLFIASGKDRDGSSNKTFFRNLNSEPFIYVSVKGRYSVDICDGESGAIQRIHSDYKNGWTVFCQPFFNNDSLIVYLSEREEDSLVNRKKLVLSQAIPLPETVNYSLGEENCLLLDMAQYKFDDTECGEDYILRLDNRIRGIAGYQKRTDAFVQPWVSGNSNPIEHTLKLTYTFNSGLCGVSADFAYEGDARIVFNGVSVCDNTGRKYIDQAINRVTLGNIVCGKNVIEMTVPFGPRTNPEACYLLGYFGVRFENGKPVVCSMPEKLAWQTLRDQSLPFYGGNVTYRTTVIVPEDGEYFAVVPHFCAPVVDVILDSGEPVPVYKEPWRAFLGSIKAGEHSLEFVCYGNRVNQFGQVHNTNKDSYWGPNSWRTVEDEWSYSYQLWDTGITADPYLQKKI